MRKQLFILFALAAVGLSSCSGGDDSSTNNGSNTDPSQLLGKWVISKAIYNDNTDTIHYESSGSCGREVLEFYTNKTVSETIYVDNNCNNGTGSEWDWWNIDNLRFGLGYSNSDVTKVITVSSNELTLDGWEDWGYRKYYKKAQ